MPHTRWNRAKQVFQEALEKSGPERTRFVAVACGDDSPLRTQVEALLAAHDEAGEFLTMRTTGENAAALAAVGVAAADRSEGPGSRIGPYKLLQLIGEGGFGVVYMAEQEEPIRRRVALKIIKPGMDTRQVIARFETERQALAMMDHPNIAKVLDAGTTETGRPYFVMELVKGVPITDYCDANHLSTRERLELFIQVCQAIHHAHEKGIIHRDIKPSNVMVTLHDGTPVPKVIDFGVAKATNQRLTEKTLFTAYGACIGTPTYMSPEQAEMSGLEVDKRSDIYSLGVLLYELLTGTTPFDAEVLRSAAFVELLRIIREEEPPTPSARLSTLGDQLVEVARNRHADPHLLTKLVRGDLDWIVMKAIEKDRRRRYDSASGLVDDVSRYFRDEPVNARRPSSLYRLRKFAKRQRVPLAAAAGIAGALVIGGGLAQFLTLGSQDASSAAVRDVDGSSVRRLEFPDDYWDGGGIALSPDGGMMAFIEESIGQNVAVYDFATKRTSLVTRLEWGSAGTEYPVWSPDGKTLAYMRSDDVPGKNTDINSIHVSAIGGSSRLVYRNDANPGGLVMPTAWLPDGSAIVTVLQVSDKGYSIGLIPAGGGAFRSLRSLQWSFDPDDAPSVSPDGRFIVFAEGPDGTRDIRVLSTDGQTGGVITDHPANDTYPRWSPDGRHIVFQSLRAGSTGLWSVAVENGRPAGEPVLVKDGMQNTWLLNWTTHGLLYVKNVSITDVFTLPIDPATGEALGKPEQVRFPRTGRNDDATWSPDGKHLAFESVAAGRTQRRLIVLPAGGGTPREFPIPTTKYRSYRLWDLRWLPDSSGLGFSGFDEQERHVMFKLTLATGQWTTWPLPANLRWTRTLWTGPEAVVYVAQGDGSRRLIQYDLITGQGRLAYVPANASTGMFRSLSLSPDRRLLAVGQTDDAGRSGVDIVDVATGKARRVVKGVAYPAWSPDGKWLITTGSYDANESHSGFHHALHVVPAADGPPRRIFPGADGSGAGAGSAGSKPRLFSPDWSPDGRRIVFVMGRNDSETWLMENVVPPGR